MSVPPNPRAVVTGGAAGLGRALCLALARRGGKVVIADRDLPGAEQTAHDVVAAGGQAEATRTDVSRLEDIEKLATLAEARFGGTDLLVNNAGVAAAGSIGSVPMKDWEWIFGINLWGVIYGCHVFAPRFKAQKSGHILNVASAAGLLCAPEMGPYNVTKAGVVALSETLAGELVPYGVGVTVLCPTFFKTNVIASSRTVEGMDAMRSLVTKWSEKSKIQADDVACIALQACDSNKLYALPMSDGRWAWRVKRLAPQAYYKLASRTFKRLQGT